MHVKLHTTTRELRHLVPHIKSAQLLTESFSHSKLCQVLTCWESAHIRSTHWESEIYTTALYNPTILTGLLNVKQVECYLIVWLISSHRVNTVGLLMRQNTIGNKSTECVNVQDVPVSSKHISGWRFELTKDGVLWQQSGVASLWPLGNWLVATQESLGIALSFMGQLRMCDNTLLRSPSLWLTLLEAFVFCFEHCYSFFGHSFCLCCWVRWAICVCCCYCCSGWVNVDGTLYNNADSSWLSVIRGCGLHPVCCALLVRSWPPVCWTVSLLTTSSSLNDFA